MDALYLAIVLVFGFFTWGLLCLAASLQGGKQ
jgi:hypothetical protein